MGGLLAVVGAAPGGRCRGESRGGQPIPPLAGGRPLQWQAGTCPAAGIMPSMPSGMGGGMSRGAASSALSPATSTPSSIASGAEASPAPTVSPSPLGHGSHAVASLSTQAGARGACAGAPTAVDAAGAAKHAGVGATPANPVPPLVLAQTPCSTGIATTGVGARNLQAELSNDVCTPTGCCPPVPVPACRCELNICSLLSSISAGSEERLPAAASRRPP